MKVIPLEPSDKNYVDKWLADQLAEFKSNTNPGKIGSVMNFLKLGFLQEAPGSLDTGVARLDPPTRAFDALQIEQGTMALAEPNHMRMPMAAALKEIENID